VLSVLCFDKTVNLFIHLCKEGFKVQAEFVLDILQEVVEFCLIVKWCSGREGQGVGLSNWGCGGGSCSCCHCHHKI